MRLKPITDFAIGLVDFPLTTPHKALEVMFGYQDIGVTPESKRAVREMFDAFLEDDSQPEQLQTAFREIQNLGRKRPSKKQYEISTGTGEDPEFGEDDLLAEVFHGAHIVRKDGGALYQRWKRTLKEIGAQERGSSHYDNRSAMDKMTNKDTNTHELATTDPQVGIDLPTGGHLLFGTCYTDETQTEIASWFQTEAMGTTMREFMPHIGDFFIHIGSGKAQVGPMGLVNRSEKTQTHLIIE